MQLAFGKVFIDYFNDVESSCICLHVDKPNRLYLVHNNCIPQSLHLG